jgi:hypothetical protein
MNRGEEIAYNYLDILYSDYRKIGMRPFGRPLDSQPVYVFVKGDDLKNPSFEWSFFNMSIIMDKSDYMALSGMFNLEPYQILKVMRLFVLNKTGDEKVMSTDTRLDLALF